MSGTRRGLRGSVEAVAEITVGRPDCKDCKEGAHKPRAHLASLSLQPDHEAIIPPAVIGNVARTATDRNLLPVRKKRY